ncbi:hypothetical protein DL96DRAFT_756772 [Flagelloscypha sp. PMI_526]|nr:hypothetical protein DL96DRAFT_756772 [Flagelloscypha sp. PMI_526]
MTMIQLSNIFKQVLQTSPSCLLRSRFSSLANTFLVKNWSFFITLLSTAIDGLLWCLCRVEIGSLSRYSGAYPSLSHFASHLLLSVYLSLGYIVSLVFRVLEFILFGFTRVLQSISFGRVPSFLAVCMSQRTEVHDIRDVSRWQQRGHELTGGRRRSRKRHNDSKQI